MGHELVHISQCGLAPETRAQFAVPGITKHQAAQSIAPMMRSPGEQCGRPCRINGFETPLSRKVHVAAEVSHDEDRSLALFAKQLGVGLGAARRYPPVDIPGSSPG